MIHLRATLSSLALVLPFFYKKFKSFCDDKNISYDMPVHLGRTLNSRNPQPVYINEHTKHRADYCKGIHGKAKQIAISRKVKRHWIVIRQDPCWRLDALCREGR